MLGARVSQTNTGSGQTGSQETAKKRDGPQAHQWGINIANSSGGTLSPPAVGEFKNGRGEFYDQETYNGKTTLVRFCVSDITANSCRFDQAFSADGGKTWEVNLIVTETLVKG